MNRVCNSTIPLPEGPAFIIATGTDVNIFVRHEDTPIPWKDYNIRCVASAENFDDNARYLGSVGVNSHVIAIPYNATPTAQENPPNATTRI